MDDPTHGTPREAGRGTGRCWGGLARNLTWFVVATACLIVQLALVVLVVANGEAPWGPLLALAWAARRWRRPGPGSPDAAGPSSRRS